MKTFETEKHNIPEGATHYRARGVSNYFAWYKRVDGVKYRWIPSYTECWDAMDDRGDFNGDHVKPIPQTNIETPEEKEALDLIDTTPQQYESVASKEVEWDGKGLPPVGVDCEWIGGGLNHGDWGLVIVHAYHNDFAWIEKLRDNSMHTVGNPAHFRKLETPQQREERDRLENGQSLYELVQSLWCTVDSKYNPHPYNSPMIDDKTKEMYARLARAVDYRKEG